MIKNENAARSWCSSSTTWAPWLKSVHFLERSLCTQVPLPEATRLWSVHVCGGEQRRPARDVDPGRKSYSLSLGSSASWHLFSFENLLLRSVSQRSCLLRHQSFFWDLFSPNTSFSRAIFFSIDHRIWISCFLRLPISLGPTVSVRICSLLRPLFSLQVYPFSFDLMSTETSFLLDLLILVTSCILRPVFWASCLLGLPAYWTPLVLNLPSPFSRDLLTQLAVRDSFSWVFPAQKIFSYLSY